jgi:hypothetical protein
LDEKKMDEEAQKLDEKKIDARTLKLGWKEDGCRNRKLGLGVNLIWVFIIWNAFV